MFTRDKGKGKHRSGHKNRPKSGNTAEATISVDEEPENLGFIYSIDPLETLYDDRHQPRILGVGGSKGNDVARLWFPPNRTNQFRRRPGYLYRWPGEAESAESEVLPDERPENLKKFQVASVFYQAKQDNFLAVLKDCTKYDIVNEDFGWSQISFHHKPGLVSMVDIGGERFSLAAPANGSSWMPQVLPEVYNFDKNPSVTPPGPSGGLCGRLSLLIAMAAFSAPVSEAESIVSKCFAWKTWEKHKLETGIGRYQERGVLVTIYLDPEAEGVTASHLKAFEEGRYGPIFAPPQQAAQYTYEQQPLHTEYAPASGSAIPRSFNPSYPLSTAPSIYTAPSGNVPPSGYMPPMTTMPPMIRESTDFYNEEDNPEEDQPEDNNE